MTIRWFASTIYGNSFWTGVAVLFPVVAALLAAAALVEIGPLLFGLADLACAACVDPSQGINTAAAGAGAAGAGAAGAGAAGAIPPPSRFTVGEYRMGYSRFQDSSGNGYWPGVSPIPDDGIVHRVVPRHPNLGGDYTQTLPVNPATGRPIFPPSPKGATERPVAAQTVGARG
jgi:hypothetical protein